MSVKILDAFNEAIKSMSEQATAKTGMESMTILKIIGGILGAIVITVWLAIILNKHREKRLALSLKPPRNVRSQRNRH